MAWYGAAELAANEVIPLAVLERPCRFREAAIASLEAAGRRYRIAVETPNLSTLRAAVDATLGVTCRMNLFLGEDAMISDGELPALPQVAIVIGRGRELGPRPCQARRPSVGGDQGALVRLPTRLGSMQSARRRGSIEV